MEKIKLNNGTYIPVIGYGTWLVYDYLAKDAVLNAIKNGYTHIDSAQAYGNEKQVGEAIRESKIARKDIYLTSKVKAEIKSYDEAKRSIEESLNKLNVDYIDLMLIHCPTPWNEYGSDKKYYEGNIEVYKAMEDYYEKGLIKSLGVSNFSIDDLEHLLPYIKVKPVINQIPVNVGHTDFELIKYCKDHDIEVEAYCPNGHGDLIKNKIVNEVAKKYGKSAAQICIRYTLDINTISLPKTLSIDHMKENLDVFDFKLTDEDINKLLSLNDVK